MKRSATRAHSKTAHSTARTEWMQQLIAHWQAAEWQACLAQAQKITQAYPDEGLAWKLSGILYQQQQDLQLASDAFAYAAKALPNDAEVFYNWANVCAQLEEPVNAIKHYRHTLTLNPEFARAYANLASLLKTTGHSKEAEQCLRQALARGVTDGSIFFELAVLLHEADKALEALQYYREATRLEPDNAVLAFNMGQALEAVHNTAEARQCYVHAMACDAAYLPVYQQLSALLLGEQAYDEAEKVLLAGLAQDAQDLHLLKNMAKLYRQTHRSREYQQALDKVMQMQTFSAEQLNNVVAELINQSLFAEADRYCQKALALEPDNPLIYCNMGLIENARSAFDKACTCFEKALETLPDSATVLSNYSVSLRMLGRYAEAVACLERALAEDPEFVSAYINLSSIYLDLGQGELAIHTLQKVLEQAPDDQLVLRNLLFSDSYFNYLPAAQYADYTRRLGALVMANTEPFTRWRVHAGDTRLRIGIVSADLRRHPVGYFLHNWLAQFDASQLEIYAYSTDGREDVLSHDLKAYCNQWRSLAGLTDQQAARQIHDDGVHILLDLSGLTGGTRLPIFAWKPAPVQATWLGYWATTGLPAMDYVIADPVIANAEVAARFTEQVAYLPHTRMCFTAPEVDVPVNVLPALSAGHVTFGCFQNYTKVNDAVLTLWGQIMQALPEARLYWQSKAFNDAGTCETALQRLQSFGIAAARCTLTGMTTREVYLNHHHLVDMILDTFPFTGGTTTCEALWMGVPTLTLPGDTMIARQGASMLHCAGLDDWIAATPEDYIEKAIGFARDTATLAALRQGLRAQVLQSPLMNAQQFAADFQHLLFDLWQQAQPQLQAAQYLAEAPIQHAFSGEQPVWIVSATRMDETTFWRDAALGRSLKRHMQQDARLVPKIYCDNRRGLSEIFNEAIEAAPENALLVLIHDDVWIDENTFVHSILQGLQHYDVIGVAGNRRCMPGQPAWSFVDDKFTWDVEENLSGLVAHGQHAFGPASEYGTPGPCMLMDGVFKAMHKRVLLNTAARYDSTFDFEFYDLDFCRSATESGLKLGTWPVRLTHQSGGNFGKQRWRDKYQVYLRKWYPDMVAATVSPSLQAAIEQVFDQALQRHQQGDTAHARQLYEEILKVSPQHALAMHNLALLEWAANPSAQALQLFASAYSLAPAEWQLLSSYLTALAERGEYAQLQQVFDHAWADGKHAAALRVFAQALGLQRPASDAELQAEQPDTEQEMAICALFAQQEYLAMETQLEALLAQYPRWLNGWKMWADVRMVQKLDAREPARQALALNSQDAKEHCYYGLVLKTQGDLQGAAHAFAQAITRKPDYAAAYNNLGIVLKDLGQVDEAIAQFKQALALQPDYAECFSNLLFCMTHAEQIDSAALMQAHRAYADCYEAPLKAAWQSHANLPDPQRTLNIGWVSADFRAHSVAHFLLPLLSALANHSSLRLVAYSNNPLADTVTTEMQGYFAQWHTVSSLSDEALADQIRSDSIDILIDLSGHTAGNRLRTFARKPAPVQLSWLGYLNTTGLQAMDYYLADPYLLPPGQFDDQFSEKVVQLPVNAPFAPFAQAPEVNALPALNNGFITFGCFNRLNKITRATIQSWAALLQQLPDSQLIIGGADEGGSSHLQAWLAEAGIDASRTRVYPRTDMATYLGYYHQVDICLDTFPSNGVTTTAHALWMGVPTLCVAGDRLASRGAAALMQCLGLQSWVVPENSQLAKHGVQLCQDLQALAQLRAGMRTRVAASAMMDTRAFADSFAHVLRHVWRGWCAHAMPASFSYLDLQSQSPQPSMIGTSMLANTAMTASPSLTPVHALSARLQQAMDYQQAGEVALAGEIYQQVLAQVPDHALAHHQLGFITAHTESVEDALKHFEAALSAEPANEQYWVSYIDALIMLGDTATAAQAIEQGQQYGLSEAMAGILTQESVEKMEAAWMSQQTAQQTSPAASAPTGALHQSAAEVIAQAQHSVAKGDIATATTLYQEILHLLPTHAQANHEYGRLLAETESLDVALPYLEAAIANAPASEQYWVTYIDALIQLGALKTVFDAITAGSKYALSAEMQTTLTQDAVHHAIDVLGHDGVDVTHTLNALIQDTGLFDRIAQDNIRALQQAQQSGAGVSGNMDLTACQQFLTQFPALLEPARLLPFIRVMVAKLMWVPELIGHKIFAPYFDQLLSQVRLQTTTAQPRHSKHANVVIATEVYDFGGHTKEIISILNTVENPMLVITDLYGRFASQPFYQKIVSALPAHCPVVVLPQEGYVQKSTRLAGLINQQARNVFLLTHHDDVVAAVACQPQLDAHYYFIHHADHNMAIGNAIPHLQHIDLFGGRVQQCHEDLQRETGFLPTTAADLGCKDFTAPHSACGTVTAGSFGKFKTEGAIALAHIICQCLQLTNGKHYHFGEIPPQMLVQLQTYLQQQGVDASRLVYAGNVPSLWKALLAIDAHVFIGSAPIMGAKSDIEAQGAGYPLLAYKALDCPRHMNVGSHGPHTHYWHDMQSLREGLAAIMANHAPLSLASRTYYEQSCSMQSYQHALATMEQS